MENRFNNIYIRLWCWHLVQFRFNVRRALLATLVRWLRSLSTIKSRFPLSVGLAEAWTRNLLLSLYGQQHPRQSGVWGIHISTGKACQDLYIKGGLFTQWQSYNLFRDCTWHNVHLKRQSRQSDCRGIKVVTQRILARVTFLMPTVFWRKNKRISILALTFYHRIRTLTIVIRYEWWNRKIFHIVSLRSRKLGAVK